MEKNAANFIESFKMVTMTLQRSEIISNVCANFALEEISLLNDVHFFFLIIDPTILIKTLITIFYQKEVFKSTSRCVFLI